METVGVKEAKTALSEYLNRAAYGQERIVITSRGKPKAALVSIEDLRHLEALELQAESRLLARAIRETAHFHSLEELTEDLFEEDEA